MNKKEALKKVSTATTLADLKEIVNNTKELTGLPVVAVKTETIKENIVKVLNGAITIEELKQAKINLLKNAREQAAKVTAKESKKESKVTSEVETPKENKKDKKEKKGKKNKKETAPDPIPEKKAKKESKIEPEVKESKTGKKVAKLLAELEAIRADKDALKVFKKSNDLNIATKGLKAKEIYKAIVLLLSGNTTKDTPKGRTIAEPRPMVETIAKVDGKKAYKVNRPDTTRGFIETLLLTAKKENKPISFEELYKEVCKFGKVEKEMRKEMWKSKSGIYTTCRVTPTIIGQNDFHVTITGSGENRTFIAS